MGKNIADREDVITMFSQPSNKTTSLYAEELVAKALRCGEVYGEHDLNLFFIKELDKSIRQSMRGYWASRKSPSPYDVAFHATSLFKLQGGGNEAIHSQVGVKSYNRRLGWQNCGLSIIVTTSSEAGLTIIRQGTRADSNPMDIGSGLLISSMDFSSSIDQSTNLSSTKSSTNRSDSCSLCFDKTYRMHNRSHITEEQKRRLVQSWHFIKWEPYKEDVNQYGAHRQPISTGRDYKINQRYNRYPQHQRIQYRRKNRPN